MEPFAPAAADLQAYAGLYASDEGDAAYVVRPDGDGLILQLERRPHVRVTLKPSYLDSFEGEGVLARFQRDERGRVHTMRIGVPRVRDLHFARRAATPGSAARSAPQPSGEMLNTASLWPSGSRK